MTDALSGAPNVKARRSAFSRHEQSWELSAHSSASSAVGSAPSGARVGGDGSLAPLSTTFAAVLEGMALVEGARDGRVAENTATAAATINSTQTIQVGSGRFVATGFLASASSTAM